jgi:hypothetical protein
MSSPLWLILLGIIIIIIIIIITPFCLYGILMLISVRDNILHGGYIMVVKNLWTIAHALRKTDFYTCIHVCECRSHFCRLEETGMGINPVADTINGTT